MKLNDQIVYGIDMDFDNKNGQHIYSRKDGHTISMCPIFTLEHHPNFYEFVEYFIHWQLCERICIETRIHKIKSNYKCSSEYCPMEIPVLLMLGYYFDGNYYLFDPLSYEITFIEEEVE